METASTLTSPFDRAPKVPLGIGMLLLIMPLCLGGNLRLPQIAVQILIFSAVLLHCLTRKRHLSARLPRLRPDYILLSVAFLGCVIILQLIPVPVAVLQYFSPRVAAAYAIAGAEFGFLSADPASTFEQLLWCIGMFFLFDYVRTCESGMSGRVEHILRASITLAGALCGLLAISHWALGNELLFGVFEPIGRGKLQTSRAHWPFVNPNHLAVLIEVALMTTAGKIAVDLSQQPGAESRRMDERFILFAQNPALLFRLAGNMSALLVMLLALFLTASKAGIVLSLIGLSCIWAAYRAAVSTPASKRSIRGFFAAAGMLGVTLYILIGDFGMTIAADRLQQGLISRLDEAREALLIATSALIMDFPFFGVGLGAWDDVIARYIPADLSGYALDYAHNEYLQCFAEIGFVGFLAVSVVLSVMIRDTAQAWINRKHFKKPDSKKLTLCAGALAVALPALHCLVDFPLHIPALAILIAVQTALHMRLVDELLA